MSTILSHGVYQIHTLSQIVFELRKIDDLQAFEITVKSEGTVTRTEEQRR
jgi:hypothetical protein